MATINLGRVKPVFRGAYAGGTAYVVDDIVTSGNETFICIQASTGNATSNASYWTKLAAKGTDGTDGTDVGTTLTTQGDILYRDGSGLQRLPKGTAGQVLQMNSGATAPEYGTVSSDYVKIASGNFASATTLDIQNCFSSTYETYKLFLLMSVGSSSGSNYPEVGFLDASNNHVSGTYYVVGHEMHNNSSSAWGRWTDTANTSRFRQNDGNGFRVINTWQMTKPDELSQVELTFIRPDRAEKIGLTGHFGVSQHDYVATGSMFGYHDSTTVRKGLRINSAGGTNFNTASKYYLYGIKP